MCAMSRTDGIANTVGRSSRQMTSRRPTLPESERIGNKSMVGKRGTSEDVYGVALQRLHDRVRAGLPEPPMSSGGTAHSSGARLETRRHRYAWNRLSSRPRLGRWAMRSERIEGHEWGTYVALARSSGAEHGRAYNSRDSRSRSSRSTQIRLL